MTGGNGDARKQLLQIADTMDAGFAELEEWSQNRLSRLLGDEGRDALQEFPEDVMTGVAGAFADVYSKVLEPSARFFYFAFLTCLGVLVSGKLTLASEIAPPLRLYLILLGESADDRKSTAIKKVIEFFRRFVTEFPVCWGVGSAEGLQAVLEESGRTLLALDELKQFVSKCKIEGSVLLQCVTSLFENAHYHARTKSSSVKLENAHLSILAASTIQTYETMFGASFIDIGFLNRLWLVPGGSSRRFPIPGKIPEKDFISLGWMLGNVLKLAEEVREMQITPEARGLFDEWYLSLDQSVHAKRLDTYGLRLMPLLAINDMKREVDAVTVKKVIALCDHQFRVRTMYDPIDSDNKVAGVEEKLRRVLRARGHATERTLKKAVHVERIGLWIYSQAKTNLYRAKELKYDKKSNSYSLQVGADR